MRCIALFWVLCACAAVSHAANKPYLLPGDVAAGHAANKPYLLPGDVAPRAYDLTFVYDVDPATNFSFYAVAEILLTAKKPTKSIVLHAEDFSIANDRVTLEGPSAPGVEAVKLEDTYNFLTISLDKELKKDENYTLIIPFYGNLNDNGLDGVYISHYDDSQSESKEYLIATQFEAINARKGFPCFDEPIYKATFKVTLGHSRDFSSVSNMPLATTEQDNMLEEYWPWQTIQKTFKKEQSKFVWSSFKESLPMSTYLVAFIVSKFSHVTSPAGLSTATFRIWARKDAIAQTAYAATLGPRVLSHFEKFFNVSFPLPKQDMLAIPDFAAGAMENWGCITFRETDLLYDEKYSSFTNKERVADVIAHEIAHQWFGDLVTMKWWSDLWLNEGFASYMGSLGVSAMEPSWHTKNNDAVDGIMTVLTLDALENSHPVVVDLKNPKQIDEIFDDISYKKGAAVIRMLVNILGEDVFRKGIHNYLVKYSYSNAEQDDLWREMTEVSLQYGGLTRNVSIKEVMDTWTTQTGYPILTVIRDYSQKTLTIQQKRFLNQGTKASTAVSWWVPLRVLCETETAMEPVQWLANTEGVTDSQQFEHASKPNEWVLFNADMIAPFRVNYDQRNWELLVNTLTSPRLTSVPVLGRVQLLSDAFALAWNNQLPYSTALQLANYLRNEKEYLPLAHGLRSLFKIEVMLKRSAEYGAYQKFVRKLITQQYNEAGGLARRTIVNGEDIISVKMQTLTSNWACRMQVPGCEENAMEMFQQWMDDSDPDDHNPIPLDLRNTVYAVAVSRGNVAHWRFLLERKQRSNSAAAKDALLQALSSSRDVWVLQQLLEWTIDDSGEIRKQDAARVLNSVMSSDVGYYVAKQFLYTRVQDIHASAGQARRLGRVIKTMLGQFTTEKELKEFLEWRDANNKYLQEAELSVSQAIEAAKVNIQWMTKNKQDVVNQLREFAT